ncbi:MAG: DJ-1 family glyoxalase III [Pseudomonadota bacterium]
MTKTVLVPVADGTEEIEAIVIIDILRRAGADVTTASVMDLKITASRKTKIEADELISACAGRTYDLIAIPGGIPGAENLRDSAVLTSMIKDQAASGRLIAAVCAAPSVVLGTHGILAGKNATGYPGFAKHFEFPAPPDVPVVVDGNVVTSRGVGTVIPFALKLVELLFGEEKSAEVATAILCRG